VGKEAAARAYQRIIEDGFATAEEILAATDRYSSDPTRDPTKTKYPQGWLNDGRWMDEEAEVSHPAASVESTDPAWVVGTSEYEARVQAEEDAAIAEMS